MAKKKTKTKSQRDAKAKTAVKKVAKKGLSAAQHAIEKKTDL